MPDPTVTKILYVNQAQAGEDGVVEFDNVYPSTVEDSVIWLTGGTDGPVALASIKAPEKQGVTVSGTIAAHATGKADWLSGDTTVTLTKKGEATALQTVTLTTDKGISVSNGASAETVSFEAVENGTYIVKVAKAHFAPIEVEITVSGTAVTLDNIDLYMWGDVDLNGKINAMDVTKLRARAASGTAFTDIREELCDVDDNGKINAMDVTRLRSYASGALTQLPADK